MKTKFELLFKFKKIWLCLLVNAHFTKQEGIFPSNINLLQLEIVVSSTQLSMCEMQLSVPILVIIRPNHSNSPTRTVANVRRIGIGD
jgi:hypothetical protein